MQLTKAIELLDEIKDSGIDAGHYTAEDAIQLGIEALKRVQSLRPNNSYANATRLPGETEE